MVEDEWTNSIFPPSRMWETLGKKQYHLGYISSFEWHICQRAHPGLWSHCISPCWAPSIGLVVQPSWFYLRKDVGGNFQDGKRYFAEVFNWDSPSTILVTVCSFTRNLCDIVSFLARVCWVEGGSVRPLCNCFLVSSFSCLSIHISSSFICLISVISPCMASSTVTWLFFAMLGFSCLSFILLLVDTIDFSLLSLSLIGPTMGVTCSYRT